jgi:hypothetical protein
MIVIPVATIAIVAQALKLPAATQITIGAAIKITAIVAACR